MESRERCKKLQEELADLKELRSQIGRAYNVALDSRNFSACGELRQRIRKILEGPESEISKLRENMLPLELRKLELKKQYESQVNVALRSGLFEGSELRAQLNFLKKPLPAIERNGQKYQMPTWREVQKALRKNKEIIKEKSRQGFTKMLIVPFGYDLRTMAEKFKDKVRELDQAGTDKDGNDIPGKGIFGAGGEKVDFDRAEIYYPVWVWEGLDEKKLGYYPKHYDQKNHGGLTKDEAIKINGVWQICFVEDMPVIPLNGKDVGGRKQIDRKGSFIKGQTKIPTIQQFKAAMGNSEGAPGKRQLKDPVKYRHEKGQTPEQYLWMQMTSLLAKDKPVLMDYKNNEYCGTYLIECFNVSSLDVPIMRWYRGSGRIRLGRAGPGYQYSDCGVRVSVNIK